MRIILRHFAAWIPDDVKNGDAGLVWSYLCELVGNNWGCTCFEGIRAILQNDGGVVFFDGLDEVREKDEDAKRSIITASIREFSKPLKKCRIIITCRDYAYRKSDDWRLPENEFPVVELALFDMEQIKMFAQTWYKVIGPQKDWDENKQQFEAESLYQAIEALAYLKDIAQYPLLLTLMAQVHGRDGSLPKDRADLYERAVNLLLEHWDNRIVRDTDGVTKRQSGLILRLGIRRDTLRNVLERVAFSAHERQETDKERGSKCADISKLDLLEELEKDLESLDTAREVIEYIQERAGLLTAQGNRNYTFPHRTFQEFLAATYIMKQGDFYAMLEERIRRDLNWWREVFLLAAGSSKNVPLNISNMVSVLLPENPLGNTVQPDQAHFARLAAQALYETGFYSHVEKEKGKTGSKIFSLCYERIQQWNVEAMASDDTLEPVERAECGRSLGQLGDPRKEVMTLAHMEFCLVPGGLFYMGDGDERHPVEHLDKDFWISWYPVTNAQYMAFVDAGGYQEGRYWVEAEKEGYWKDGKFKGRYDSQPRNRPVAFKVPYHLSNHPVVGVTWYESLAFTRWLTDKWQQEDLIDKNWCIRLPSEAEWEKAARGGPEVPETPVVIKIGQKDSKKITGMKLVPNSERMYPWGDKLSKNKANYDETGINTTSAVGCFVSGKSPYGCLDMAGNVWEWTRSLYAKYPYKFLDGREDEMSNKDRVLRGGSYLIESVRLRCAARFGFNPDLRVDFWGFRCVFSPDTSGL